MSAPRFHVTYRITPDDPRPIEAHAKDICIEETVEIPEDCVPKGHWEAGIVGRIESITPRGGSPGDYDVNISYRTDIANDAIPNLLNVLFGNISIRRGIKIVDIQLTPDQLKAFGGPRFGIAGIRRDLKVHGRPLATTAIKPLGLHARELARLCGGYSLGGLDVIKDDHGLIDQHFHPFEERVARIQEAINAANARTGRVTHYYPMIAGRFDQVEAQMAFARAQGCYGVLIPPLLIGPDTGFHLARKYGLAVMTHPTFTGTHFHDPRHGMTPAMLLGRLFRIFGADISVFPNAGGRFTFTGQECHDLAAAMRGELGGLKPGFPSPAGGMTIEKVGAMVDSYGEDTALLIGGALLKYSPDPEVSARAFLTALEAAAAGKARP
ncbi:MAG: RuBisCO large subunit C-terminal-like domain-containing protein [Aestuariivirga sp.]|uniref:RuBisCO large subunit C-terminal-like domain-containing protein n=1 Tax=Aestuariivirga sp. TaxID=2650926 RepID=UPI0038D1A8A3